MITCLVLLEMLALTVQFSDLLETLDVWWNRVWPGSAPSQMSISPNTDGI